MNKVYRTVWNEHTNTWVAVQETAKARGKSSKSGGSIVSELGLGGSRFMMTAAASAVLLMSGQVMAADGNKYPTGQGSDNYCYYDTTSQSVVCGDASTSVADTYDSKTAKSTAIGFGAKTAGESNVALGAGSSAAKTAATALGASAKALNDYGVAIGYESVANNTWDISIGRRAGADAVATGDGRNIAIGDGALQGAKNANNNTVLGTSAGAGLTGGFNIAMGAYANSPTANGSPITADNTIALGQRAVASTSNSIALGNRSKATGTISNAIGASAEASGNYSVANGYAATASGNNAIAIGAAQNLPNKTEATGAAAIAIGTEAKATNRDATAIGKAANAAGQDGIAVGLNANAAGQGVVAMGTRAGVAPTGPGVTYVAPTDAVFIGSSAGHGSNNNRMQIAIGNNAGKNVGNKSTVPTTENIAIGNSAGEAVNGNTNVAISSRAGRNVEGHDNFAALLEAGENVKGNNNIAIGKQAGRGASAAAPLEVSNTIAMGFTAQGTHNDTIALGRGAKAQIEDSIAIGRGVTTEILPADNALPNNGAGNREGMIAIGSETTKASGKAAVAIGRNSQGIGRGTVALGDASKSLAGQGIAVGAQANVDAAAAGGVAIGSVAKSQGVLAVALGSQAEASAARSVAVGALSQATRAALTPNAATSNAATAAANQVYALDSATAADKTAISATVKGDLGAVSVGKADATRQIINVAAGSEDSDAVNVAQLKAVANQITNAAGTHYYSVDDNGVNGGNYSNDGAAGINALAAGVNTVAVGKNAISVGEAASANSTTGALAIGSTYVGHNLRDTALPVADGDVTLDPNHTDRGEVTTVGHAHFGQRVRKVDNEWKREVSESVKAWSDNAIAIGVGAEAGLDKANPTTHNAGKTGAIAIGTRALAYEVASVALGEQAGAFGVASTALGTEATANNQNGVAVGSGATAEADNTVAAGFKAVADGKSAVAVGDQAWTSQAASQSLALGNLAEVQGRGQTLAEIKNQDATKIANGAVKGVAVGYKAVAVADIEGGVALGAHSTADRSALGGGGNGVATSVNPVVANHTVEIVGRDKSQTATATRKTVDAVYALAAASDADKQAITETTKHTLGAVSVGGYTQNGDPQTRQITNVAAGSLDSDAVNVAQLKAVANQITNAAGTHYYSVNSSAQGAGSNYNNDGATADRALAAGVETSASGLRSTAVGNKANAQASDTVVIGNEAVADNKAESAVVIGSKASVGGAPSGQNSKDAVAIGYSAHARTASSIALGSNAKADDKSQASAIGYNANAKGYQSIAFGSNSVAGTNAGAAVVIGVDANAQTAKSVALGNGATVAPAGIQNQDGTGSRGSFSAIAVGDAARVAGEGSIAIGKSSQTTYINSTAVGNEAAAVGYNTSAFGYQAKAAGTSSIALGDKALAGSHVAGSTSVPHTSRAVAIGTNTNATGETAVALGSNAESKAHRGTALGVLSQVTQHDGAALGAYSVANRAAGLAGSDILNAKDPATHASAWTATHAAVSVGNDTPNSASPRQGNSATAGSFNIPLVTRQITGVAAGTRDTDAVNVAQLNTVANHTKNVGDTIVNVLGGDAAITPQGNISMSDIGGTGKGNIHDAIAAATTKVTSNDKSVTVDHDAASNTYDLAVNTDNTTIVKGANGELKANTAPITTVAVGQPNAGSVSVATGDEGKLATAGDIANAINNSGFTLTAAGQNGSLVKPGATVDLKNTDGNIVISKAAGDNNVNFDLAPTVKIGTDPAAGGNQITINGAAGTIEGLKNTLPVTQNNTAAPNTPSNATTVQTAPTLTQAQQTQAATVGDVLNAGWNLQTNGVATDFVRPYDTVNFTGKGGATVSSTTDGAITTITVDVNAQNLAETAQLPVVYTDAAGNKVYLVEKDDPLNPGTKIKVFNTAADGTGTDVDAANVIASMQSPDGKTVNAPTKLANVAPGVNDTDAVNVSQLKGAADALGGGAGINPDGSFKAPSYVINKTDGSQYAPVDNVGDALSNLNAEVVRPLTFAGDTGANVERKLGSTVNVKGGATGNLTNGNIGVEANGSDTLTIKLAENIDLGASGSVKTGNTTVNNAGVTIANPADPSKNVSLTDSGLNNGGNKITNVAAGTDPTDAVNVSQLEAAAAAAKTTLTSNDKSVTLVHDSTNNSYDLAVNTDGTTITKDPTTGTLKANTTAINTTPDGQAQVAPADAGKLTTAGDIANAINNSGFNLTANGANGSLVKPGSTVDLKNTDGNIAISKAGTDNNVGFDLAPVLNVGPTAGGNPVTINGNAGTIGGLTNTTWNGTPVSGRAATEDQLAQVAQAAGSRNTVSAGSNITITPTTNANGSTNYQVATNPDMVLTSVTTTDAAGNQTVTNGNGVTITPQGKAPVSLTGDGLNNGGNKITNVAAGANDTDAVNVKQLNDAINNVNVTIPGQLNNRLNGIEGRLDKVENTANAGVAQAIATAGLPQAYLPGKSMIAVGGGYYRGETGYAVGFSTISDGGNWIIKGTASGNSRGHFGASVGAGYQW